MAYFSSHYDKLRFPIAETGRPGFRPAQLAAVQAVSSHFFGAQTPAIVAMPTGAGKTTVLMACAFTLRAERVLIVTPSRLVREQIAETFQLLRDLKMIGALPTNIIAPKVFTAARKIATE
jgi:superfamily II DNA or RNA helicase